MPQLEQVEFFISQLFWLGVFFVVLFSVLTYITLPKIRAFLNKRDDFVKSHISKPVSYTHLTLPTTPYV